MVTNGMGLYTGETSRSLFERAGEHMAAARGLQRGSHMIKHWFLDHPGVEELPGFKFRIIGKYKDSMTRQIKEAIRVQNRPGNLNSKGEFGGGTIPRLVVEVSDYEKKKAELEERKREEEENDRWMEFLKKREISKTNVRKRVLPDWLDLENVQKPVKRMKLEEVTSFPASPNQNPEPELERSIMTITNRKIFQP